MVSTYFAAPLAFGLNIYYGYKTFKFLKGYGSSFSSATRKRAVATIKVISLQATLPLCVLIPIVIYAANFRQDYFHIRVIAYAIFSWLPAIDPLIPIYFVTSYRKALLQFLR